MSPSPVRATLVPCLSKPLKSISGIRSRAPSPCMHASLMHASTTSYTLRPPSPSPSPMVHPTPHRLHMALHPTPHRPLMALNSSNIPQAPTSESANAISTVANIFKLTEAVCAVASCVALLQLISRNNRIITNTASSSTAPKAQHPSTSAITSTKVNAKRQQTVQASSAPAPALPFSYGTQQLGLLPMALLAGAILSGLVSRTLESFIRPPPVASGRGSAESALRIARLEAQNKQQAEALEKMASLVEKLQIRFRMLNANVKEPLAQAFTNLQVQTDVLTVHSDKHKQLSKRIEGIEELILALQAVSAKQFDVIVKSLKSGR